MPPKGLSIRVTCRRRMSKWHTISGENVEISSSMIPATMSLKLRAANSTPNPWFRRNLTSSFALKGDGRCWCTSGRQRKSPENVSPPIAVAVIALKEVQMNSFPLDLAASRRAKIRRVFPVPAGPRTSFGFVSSGPFCSSIKRTTSSKTTA